MTDVDVERDEELDEDEEVADEGAGAAPTGILSRSVDEPVGYDLGDGEGGVDGGDGHGGDEYGGGDDGLGATWVKASELSQPSQKPKDAWIIRLGQRLCGGGRAG